MICFYHSADLDGHCSGAIVKRRFPECELYGINYGDAFPWEKAKGDVVMVDFSLQPHSEMKRLAESCCVIWVDHHKTAIDEWNSDPFGCKGKFEVGKAGCELAWEYFFPFEEMPEAVKLLGRYDVWDHSDSRTLPFQYAMRLFDTFPEKNMTLWDGLFKTDNILFNDILGKGETVLQYVQMDNEKYCKACAFDTPFDGLKCVAINKMLTNSQVFESVWDAEKYDAMLTFGFRKGRWTVSLYSDKPDIDVSVVAKRRGGGGHKGAAGFQCDELPWAR